jgi:hypothetical protein
MERSVVVAATAVPAATPAPTFVSPATTIAGQADNYIPITSAYHPNHLIVKNAELKLLVSDTDIAIGRVNQIAADCSGYIISTRVGYQEWLGGQYKYASITNRNRHLARHRRPAAAGNRDWPARRGRLGRPAVEQVQKASRKLNPGTDAQAA